MSVSKPIGNDDIQRGRCWRCNMGYRVQDPRPQGMKPEFTKCADCGLMFWHANAGYGTPAAGHAIIGVGIVDYAAFLGLEPAQMELHP